MQTDARPQLQCGFMGVPRVVFRTLINLDTFYFTRTFHYYFLEYFYFIISIKDSNLRRMERQTINSADH